MGPAGGGGVRLVEVLAALSLGSDLGMGQPAGHAVRTCLIAMSLGAELGVDESVRPEVFYVGLLRYIGCTADAFEGARFAEDEIEFAVAVGPYVMADQAEQVQAAGLTGLERADVERVKAAAMTAHCEAAGLLAGRLGLGEGVVTALRHAFERWDGTGHPAGLAGEAIPLATRIAVVARDVELWQRRGGAAAACAVVRQRRGRAYDPAVADAFLSAGGRILERLGDDPLDRMLAAEPAAVRVAAERLDGLLEVLADFADVKLPYALGHSRAVAALAAGAAGEVGLDPETVALVRRAGLVHDLGRAGISNRIWDKPAGLSVDEWERVRLHPYLSERILTRTELLRPLASLAGSHHERQDGSGYHRGAAKATLSMAQRILAAADAYAAMRQDRPYRTALSPSAAVAELADEVRRGRLDRRAVAAVAAAAGHTQIRLPAAWPRGLTDREVDVLRLACRGLSKQIVADRLGISAKTVGRHLENSYAKIDVSSRAGAALFAVEHGLLTAED